MSTENATNTAEQIKTKEMSLDNKSLGEEANLIESDISSKTQDALANNESKAKGLENYGESTDTDKQETEKIKLGTANAIEDLNTETVNSINALLGQQENAVTPNESKESYPENHIMNPKMLDKIARLESINPHTLEFDQSHYDEYINGQEKLGNSSVGKIQKAIQEGLDMGDNIADVNPESIYGQGGLNRYVVNIMDGTVSLSEAKDQSSGSPEYRAKLAQEAKKILGN